MADTNRIIPLRTSVDTNSTDDINELSNQALDKGGTSQITNITEDAAPASGDLFLMEKSTGELRKVDTDNMPGGGGGSMSNFIIDIPAASFNFPAADLAELNTDTATNIRFKEHLMDDTTEEFALAQISVPHQITTGTVNFYVYGRAVTADGNEIQLRFSHAAVDKNEDIDSATYTTEDSGDYSTSSTQNALDEVTWSETVTNLGWSAGDMLYIKISRIAIDDGTPVTGDWGFQHLRITGPRA